jgi:hypothetical protein
MKKISPQHSKESPAYIYLDEDRTEDRTIENNGQVGTLVLFETVPNIFTLL